MVVQPVADDRAETSVLRPVVSQLVLVLTTVTLLMLLLLGGWLAARRAGGQLREPLDMLSLATVLVTVAGLVTLSRILWHRLGLSPRLWKSRYMLLWGGPTIVVLVLASSLSIPGTGAFRLSLFWTVLLLLEAASWWFIWRQIRLAQRGGGDRRSGVWDAATLPSTASAVEGTEAEAQDDDAPLSEEVSQQITRSCAEKESDTVTGLLRAQFAPRERSRSLHVAFCPPMLHCPGVTVVQLSGAAARIKAGDVQPFGVRFDLRLSAASNEAQEALIHFEARCSHSQTARAGGSRNG